MTPTSTAAIWMIGAILSFTAMAISGRIVTTELDTFELMFFRSLLGIVIVFTVAGLAGKLHEARTQRLGLHVIRNICHFIGQNSWFFALTIIPLAEVVALEFTSPIWAMLLAPLVLSEKITRFRVLAGIAGFIGVLIVARPAPESLNIGQIAAATSAVFFALTALFTRRLTRDQSITSILVYLTVIQAILGLIAAGWDGDIALPSAQMWPWVGVVALAGLVAHFCLTTALALAPAAVVMPLDFARLPLVAFAGWVLFTESLDVFVLVGAAIIFGANYANLLHERRDGASKHAG